MTRHKSTLFVPGRLKEARLAKRWSLDDLADRIGLTRQAISQFELGISSPSDSTLDGLARELDRPMNFFFWQQSAPMDGTSIVFYRKQRGASAKEFAPVHSYLSWLFEMVIRLEEWVVVPPVLIEPLATVRHEPTDGDIEEAATQLRRQMHLGNGPISNMTRLLEHQGITVAHWQYSKAPVDAGSQWIGHKPLVLIGRAGVSAVRQRFSAAHELGHLVLHAHLAESEFKKKYAQYEGEADKFAAAFLLPAESFGRECVAASMTFLQNLKLRWKVSIQSMIGRGGTLGIFSPDDVTRLNKQVRARGWYRQEPWDGEWELETPVLFEQGLSAVAQDAPHIYTTFRDEIPLPLPDIVGLTHVPAERWESSVLPGTVIRNLHDNRPTRSSR